MCLRGKSFFITALAVVLMSAFMLSGCERNIESPFDELRGYSWQGELENGNTVTLSFDDSNARLSVENEDFSLDISGLCVPDDGSFVIFDENSDANYSFDYRLYGDRVELIAEGGELSLEKQR